MNRREALKTSIAAAALAGPRAARLLIPSARAADCPQGRGAHPDLRTGRAVRPLVPELQPSSPSRRSTPREASSGGPSSPCSRTSAALPADATKAALKLWKGEGVEAFIGMHDSAVRGALTNLFKGQVPYVYTPVYEGGECSAGTYVLGETPTQQLEPVVPWIASNRGASRWYLIGNDYNWPRDTNAAAKGYIGASSGYGRRRGVPAVHGRQLRLEPREDQGDGGRRGPHHPGRRAPRSGSTGRSRASASRAGRSASGPSSRRTPWPASGRRARRTSIPRPATSRASTPRPRTPSRRRTPQRSAPMRRSSTPWRVLLRGLQAARRPRETGRLAVPGRVGRGGGRDELRRPPRPGDHAGPARLPGHLPRGGGRRGVPGHRDLRERRGREQLRLNGA